MGVGVDEDLDGEDDGEEGVELLELVAQRGKIAAAVRQQVHDLRLRRVHHEVLLAAARAILTARPALGGVPKQRAWAALPP